MQPDSVLSEKTKVEHRRFGTKAIHGGVTRHKATGAVTIPISLATTFAQASPGVKTGGDHYESHGNGWEYSRTGNPTRGAFETVMASLENGKHGIAFSSGMAATTAVIHLLKSGDHVVCVDDVYGGTQRYFRRVATKFGLEFDFMDIASEEALERAIKPGVSKLIWLESPSNPLLKITDIKMAATVAKRHNMLLIVDNTFMSPYFQNPLDLGADLVVHSLTKYVNGHSDVVGGVIVTKDDELATSLRFIQNTMGAVPSPFDSYLVMRGIKTLHLRMREHAKNAMAVAKYLEAHPGVEKVLYPGLPSHPQHKIAVQQMHGFGGMVTFYVKGDVEDARKVLENFKVFTLAESLGAVESLAESPAIMTHASVPKEKREELGISDSLIRLSVGVEDTEDLIEDLEKALAFLVKA